MANPPKTGSDGEDDAHKSIEPAENEEQKPEDANREEAGKQTGEADTAADDSVHEPEPGHEDAADRRWDAEHGDAETAMDEGVRGEDAGDRDADEEPGAQDMTEESGFAAAENRSEASAEATESLEGQRDATADTEPAAESQERPEQRAPAERVVVERKGGFVPMVLGGVVAAAVGYGVAWWQTQQGATLATTVDAQGDRIGAVEESLAGLNEDVAALSEGPDMSGVEARLTELSEGLSTATGRLDSVQAEVTGSVGGLTDRVAEIDDRLTNLEQRTTTVEEGTGDATLAEEAIASYEREVTALREELRAQMDQLTAMAEEAEAQLQAARDEIEATEAAAAEAARAASIRALLGEVAEAVRSGASYAAPLSDLRTLAEAQVPEALQGAAEEGIPTVDALQETFPEAARAGLAAARESEAEAGGFGDVLRSTFNVRSVTPREGSDPDAVLSRMDAAVSEGRIADALAEAEALPDVVRDAMSDWLSAARSRADALSALDALGQDLNDN